LPTATPTPEALSLPITDLYTPSLAAFVTLALDQEIITLASTATLTLTVYNNSETELTGLTASVTLPPSVATTDGSRGDLTWPVPLLTPHQPFVQVVELALDASTLPTTAAVVRLSAAVSAADYAPGTAEALLGLAPAGIAESTTLGATGAIVQSADGDITVLVAPGAAAEGASFGYTELYDWADVITEPLTVTVTPTLLPVDEPTATPTPSALATDAPTQTAAATPTVLLHSDAPSASATPATPLNPSATPTVTGVLTAATALIITATAAGAGELYLPVTLREGAAAADAVPLPTATATPSAAVPQPVPNANVDAYKVWHLTALQDGVAPESFAAPVQLAVSARALVAGGVDPQRLQIWTRAEVDQPWEPVETIYDAVQQRFQAWLPHFSDFTLAEGLATSGHLLPSVRAFSVDRFSGGATLQIPIAAPSGLGGLVPALSLSYSSTTIDDMYRDKGDNAYDVQASGLGLGWNLSGVSYIARAGGNLDNNTLYINRQYVMVLGGQFVRIQYEDNAWRTDPAIFAKIERTTAGYGKDCDPWTITTADGTKYTFGGASTCNGYSSTSAIGTHVQRQNGGADERMAYTWYLTQVEDRLGNRMTYSYHNEQGIEKCHVGENADLQWYNRAIYPDEIQWSTRAGYSAQLRVDFTYDGTDRQDYQIDKWGENDCTSARFAKRNRLQSIAVQFKNSSGNWQTIRSYVLSSGYTGGVSVAGECDASNNYCKRLLLNSVQVRGKDNGTLLTYTFTNNGTHPSNIRLGTVRTSYGGQVTYTYTIHRPSCGGANCYGGFDWIWAVTHTDTYDGQGSGLGNRRRVAYYYGPTNDPTWQNRWGIVAQSKEWLGFKQVDVAAYTLNSNTNPLRWESQKTELGSNQDPDPRRGRIFESQVRAGTSNGTLLAFNTYTWRAYRRNAIGTCSQAVEDGWCMEPSTKNTYNPGSKYMTLWVRLEASDAWQDGSGKLTKHFYKTSEQNGGHYGNVTEVHEYSHSEDALAHGTWQNRVSSGSVNLLRYTKTNYYPNSTAHLVNLPARVRVYDGAHNCLAQTRTVYVDTVGGTQNRYGNYAAAPGTGLPARIDRQRPAGGCLDSEATPNGSSTVFYNTTWKDNWAVTFLGYNSYGHQTVVRAAGDTEAQDDYLYTDYDTTYNLFPVTQRATTNVNTVYRETARYYGVNESGLSGGSGPWGAMKEHCAVNETCTRQSYDQFGRPTYRWERAASSSGWEGNTSAAVSWSYRNPGYYGASHKTYIVTEWRAPRCYGNFVRRHYDGLGQVITENRPYQNWQEPYEGCGGSSSGQEIDVNYAYDALGNPVKASVPRLVARANFATRAADLSVATTTDYDALSRPSTITAPNGEVTSYVYGGRTSGIYTRDRAKATNQADAYKMSKWQTVDGLGYLKTVYSRKWTGSGWSTVAQENLTHDSLGNLTEVSHAAGAGATSLTYDRLGRKLTMNDADLGSWSYAYDRQGHLTRQTDARGKTICLYYDNLGRLIGKHFRSDTSCPASVTTYDVRYVYDANHSSSNRSRGQLTYVENSGSWWKYN